LILSRRYASLKDSFCAAS
jgi:hypothetical protein